MRSQLDGGFCDEARQLGQRFPGGLTTLAYARMGDAGRVKLNLYPGGHMFYSRPDSMAAFRRDVMKMYGAG